MTSRLFRIKPVHDHLVRPRGGLSGEIFNLRQELGESFEHIETVTGDPSVVNQASWYVDQTAGNDDNDGDDVAAPLASLSELNRRLGSYEVQVPVTVQVTGDLDEGSLTLSANCPQGLSIEGVPTTIFTGVLTAGTQGFDTSLIPVQDCRIVDAALPADWVDSGPGGTSLVYKLIRITSGINTGATAWIMKDLGGKVARCSQFMKADGSSTSPGAGASYEVLDLPIINVDGAPNLLVDAPPFSKILLKNLHIKGGAVTTEPVVMTQSGVEFWRCKIEGRAPYFRSVSDIRGLVLANTLIRVTNSAKVDFCGGPSIYLWGVAGANVSFRFNAGSNAVFYKNNIGQADGTMLPWIEMCPGSYVNIDDLSSYGAFDSATIVWSTAYIQANGTLDLGNSAVLWDQNRAGGKGMFVRAGGKCHWSGGNAVDFFKFDAGVASELSIGGTISTVAALGAVGFFNVANGAGIFPDA